VLSQLPIDQFVNSPFDTEDDDDGDSDDDD